MTLTGGCHGILYIEVYHSHLERLSQKRPASLMQQNYLQNVIQKDVCNQLSFPVTKRHHTVKALVAISPCVHVMFLPRLFTGALADRELAKQYGFSINLCLEIKSWQTNGLLLLTFSWTLGISCANYFSKRRRPVY